MACTGNACDAFQLTWDGGCHVVHNISQRRIRVAVGAFSNVIAPGQAWRIVGLDGHCVQIIIGSTIANYVD